MNKTIHVIVIIALLTTLIGAAREEGSFAVKIMPGVTWLSGGDLAAWLENQQDLASWWNGQPGYSAEGHFSYRGFSWQPALEVTWQLSGRFALALGTGWFSRGWTSDVALTHDFGAVLGSDTLSGDTEIKATVVPLTLSAVLRLPLTERLEAQLRAGAGYYFARLDISQKTMHSWPLAPAMNNYRYEGLSDARLSAAAPGFTLVSTLIWKLNRTLGVSLDVGYRFLSIDHFKGERDVSVATAWDGYQQEASDTLKDQELWTGENRMGGNTFTAMILNSGRPEGLSSVRSFSMGLSGVAVAVGVVIFL